MFDRSKNGAHSTYLYKKHESSLKIGHDKSIKHYSMLNENEYKNKLKSMYRKAAQRSLRMSQKYSQDSVGPKEQNYNRALYPSVTQVSKYESAKQPTNQR